MIPGVGHVLSIFCFCIRYSLYRYATVETLVSRQKATTVDIVKVTGFQGLGFPQLAPANESSAFSDSSIISVLSTRSSLMPLPERGGSASPIT